MQIDGGPVCFSSVRLNGHTRFGSGVLNVSMPAARRLGCPQLGPQHPQLLVRPVDPVGPVATQGASVSLGGGCWWWCMCCCRGMALVAQGEARTDRMRYDCSSLSRSFSGQIGISLTISSATGVFLNACATYHIGTAAKL